MDKFLRELSVYVEAFLEWLQALIDKNDPEPDPVDPIDPVEPDEPITPDEPVVDPEVEACLKDL